MNAVYVNTNDALQQVCEGLQAQAVIAVDTEFMREKTYYAQLCLIQLAGADFIACIDPLQLDISPILDILYDARITKILHSARQDLEVLFDLRQALPENVFDTQIAATFLGQGEQLGYAALVKNMFEVDLAKSQTRTDWSQRPLDEQQLLYAADDVRYLIPIYQRQMKALEEMERLDWALEEFQQLSQPELLHKPQNSLWQRVKNWQGLRGNELAVLQALAEWREVVAQQDNKPRRWVVSDNKLINVAKYQPVAMEKLAEIIGPKLVKQYGEQLLTMIAAAAALPPTEWPRPKLRTEFNQAQSSLIKSMMNLVKSRAQQYDLPPSLVATRKDIERIVGGHSVERLLHGWRYSVAGQALQGLLAAGQSLPLATGNSPSA